MPDPVFLYAIRARERHNDDLGAHHLKSIEPLLNLNQVSLTGESSEVPQEDQDERRPDKALHRYFLSVFCL
jgi:hypothetical protein